MKNRISRSISLLLLISYIPLSTPALAQSDKKVEFYCGRTQDSAKRPVTLAMIRGVRREDTALILWSNLGNMTARERCELVSQRFQNAWDRGGFNILGSGVDKNGSGLICAFRKQGQTCDSSNILFTLKNGQESQETIDRLLRILKANEVGIGALINIDIDNPILRTKNEFPSIDMQNLIKVISTAQKVD
jgi:Circadian oscillating protein COP23